MMRIITIIATMLVAILTSAQENLQKQASNKEVEKMLIYGKAVDEQGKPYYMVKNSWGKNGAYKGIWYMSRDFIALNTTYLFLNRHALSKNLREAIKTSDFH